MDSEKIKYLQENYNLPAYRCQQLKEAFFQKHISEYTNITTFPKKLRGKLQEEVPVLTASLYKIYASQEKNAYKALLQLKDKRLVETVLLNPKPGLWSCCISSQVGCVLGCTFCATGTMGLARNLSSEEITDQVLFWQFFIEEEKIPARLSNVVYMGMGEPFHNKKEVFKSLRELMNPETFHLGARHLSVSTSGLVPAIYEFTEQFPQVNLAISLHAPNNELRVKLMPINKPYPLEKLMAAIEHYIEATNRKVFIEYIMLKEENDSLVLADQLADLLKKVSKSHLLHVNLIVYNQTDSEHKETPKEKARKFKSRLEEKGVSATIRKNLGRDIDGACGQLALKEPGPTTYFQSTNFVEVI